MNKLIAFLIKKPISVSILILLQLGFIYLFVFFMSVRLTETYFILQVLNVILVVYIINRYDNPSYKLTWIVFILVVPLVGGITYLMFGGRKVPKDLRSGIKQLSPHEPLLEQNEKVIERIKDPFLLKQTNYLYEYNGMPVFEQSKVIYHRSGESKFEAMMQAIKAAKDFIFLEYFIIKPGFLWDTLFDVLKEKIEAGVDVRFIYDDMGCSFMGLEFLDELRQAGIKAYSFNPIRPILAITMNNRDHRKIAVIDGQIGFIGGINLADEYINLTHPFGHWKDIAIEIRGEAVYGLTLMFLQFYDYLAQVTSDFHQYRVETKKYRGQGYIQLYSDSPTDDEPVSQMMHLNLINSARTSITIMTPYLIVGYEIIIALIAAAKSGICVKVIVPHIPDKRYVFSVTQSNYEHLIQNGIEIYEYLPGFMHAKLILVDNRVATIGTANLDFRSYFLHFECGALLFDSPSLTLIREDVESTLEQCVQITLEDAQSIPLVIKFWRAILNVFSTLL
jgi:cardiolipin synthase A/B